MSHKKYTIQDILNGETDSFSVRRDSRHNSRRLLDSENYEMHKPRHSVSDKYPEYTFDEKYPMGGETVYDELSRKRSSFEMSEASDKSERQDAASVYHEAGHAPQHQLDLAYTQNFAAALVVDTNFMLSELTIVDELWKLAQQYGYFIIIPDAVIHELDGLKKSTKPIQIHEFTGSDSKENELKSKHASSKLKSTTVGYSSRTSTEWIRSALARKDPYVIVQKSKQKLDQSLRGDDSILDCCLYFQDQYLTVILSNDKNLCIRSLKEDMRTVTYVDGLTPLEIAINVSREVPSWRQELYQKLQNEGHSSLHPSKKVQRPVWSNTKSRKESQQDVEKILARNVKSEKKIPIEKNTKKAHADTNMDIDNTKKENQNNADIHYTNGSEDIEMEDHPHSQTKPVSQNPENMEIDSEFLHKESKHKKKKRKNASKKCKYSTNPVVEKEIQALYTKFHEFTVTQNVDMFCEELSKTLVDYISPIVCKTIIIKVPNPEAAKNILGVRKLERVFVMHKTELNTKFVWDASQVYHLKSLASMIEVLGSFAETLPDSLVTMFEYEKFDSLGGAFAEPSTYHLTKANVLSGKQGSRTVNSRRNSKGKENKRPADYQWETEAQDVIDEFQADVHRFVSKWTRLWLELELVDISREHQGESALEKNDDQKNVITFVKDYIEGTRKVLIECVSGIF